MENLLKSDDLQHAGLQEIIGLVQGGTMPSPAQIDAIQSYLIADRVVSKNEAELMFYLKREFPAIMDVDGFADLFVNGITSFLLYTGETPGALDNIEYIWLQGHFAEDHQFDDFEKRLFINLASRAEDAPANFHELAKSI